MLDWSHVASDLVAQGSDGAQPEVTIAITTYKRADFLTDAVRSALAQDLGPSVEIMVVDNDPGSQGFAALAAAVPELLTRKYRYYVHRQNIGMFGNFNRGIELARAEWMTILNDDDLLDPGCISASLRLLRAHRADGIFCEKRILDQRGVAERLPQGPGTPPMTVGRALRSLIGNHAERRDVLARIRGRGVTEWKYLGRPSRRIHPHIFFWGSLVGNGAGFVFKTQAARELGGYYAEEFPSSDHYFHARFAGRFHLRQSRKIAASYRIAENESAKLDTVLLGIRQAHRLQTLMLGHEVPRWWRRFIPLLGAFYVADARFVWNADVPTDKVEEILGEPLPKPRPRFLWRSRLLLRGL